jgi:hypothetical protein
MVEHGEASISADICLFHLLRLFWNHILICVSVSFKELAKAALSELDKYRLRSNVVSN